MAETLQAIIKQAGEIVEAIAFDDCGAVVGDHLVGGNGGLLSRQTIMKADAEALAALEGAAQ